MKISGTELRRAALELKIAQAVEKLKGGAASGPAEALAILGRDAKADEAEFHRQQGTPQPRLGYVYTPWQRVVRALEGVSATFDSDECFTVEVSDGAKVERIEMRAGAFEVVPC